MGNLINLGKGLLSKYDAEVEYLESTGTQYIDTGIIPNQDYSYEVQVWVDDSEQLGQVIPLGSWDGWLQNMFGSYMNYGSIYGKQTNVAWGNQYVDNYNGVTDQWITLHDSNGHQVIRTSSEILNERNYTAAFQCTGSVLLFARGVKGEVAAYSHPIKMSYVKIWNLDTLIMDLNPVRVGRVGYMYDKVSGKLFGNSGTGSFILGADVEKAKYDTEIEYLESTGTQYINTSIIQNTRNFEAHMLFQWTGSNTSLFETFCGYMLQNSITPRFGLHKYQGNLMFGTNNTTTTSKAIDNDVHEIYLTSNETTQEESLYLDGTLLATGSTTSDGISANTIPIVLFARNRGSSIENFATVRIMSFKYEIYSDSTHTNLVKEYDLVPVRIGRIGCMYDKVSKKMLGNSGTGSFILGQDKSPYEDYEIAYHWEAEDWTEGTDWVDRVGGLVLTKVGNPTKEHGLIGCCYNNGYFTLDLNAAAPNGVRMGSLWAVDVEFLTNYDSNIKNGQSQISVDFGALSDSRHAFMFASSWTHYLSFNPKLTGNNSASLYSQTYYFKPYYGKVVKATMGTVMESPTDETSVIRPFYLFDGEIKYSPNTLTRVQAMFNRNFSRNKMLVGTGNATIDIHGDTYDNINFNKYIKSIKVYRNIYEIVTIRLSQNGGNDSVLIGNIVTVLTPNSSIIYQGAWDGNDITLKILEGDTSYYIVRVDSITDYWISSVTQQYTAVGGYKRNIEFKFLYKSVDLGLPSGRIWSRGSLVKDANGQYDIGEPMDVGTYHSWANIDGHNKSEGYAFTQANYETTAGWQQASSISNDDAEHDICRARLGAPWHLPSITDISELHNNTDKELIEIDGTSVLKLMKKTDHSIYILMPLHGNYYGNWKNVRYEFWANNYAGKSAGTITTGYLCTAYSDGVGWNGLVGYNGYEARPVM